MNPLHVAAEALSGAAATALSQSMPTLAMDLDTLSVRLLQEADDAQEQIDDGLDAQSALMCGLAAAVAPPPRSLHWLIMLSVGILVGTIGTYLLG